VAVYYIEADHLNTPRQVTRPSDNKQMWTWFADPFGTTAANSNPAGAGTFTYNLRFPGQIYDSQAGLSQNVFRDYDPAIGRYVESDPIGLKGGVNTYWYANSNPIQLSDPFGLIVLWPLFNLPSRDDCKMSEWKQCEVQCAPGRVLGCYVSVTWKLKGIRNGEPIRVEQRKVNCNCEQLSCPNSARVFVPGLSPAPFFAPLTSPALVPAFP
jgi:RHS repeat-associated protein